MPEDIKQVILADFTTLNAQYVAVRSSATAEDGADASWAGELDSFLNTTQDSLLTNVQRCWASLFTPRAIVYRFEKGFSKSKVSVAVVVQKMINAEVSGIAFSVHPVTEDPNQLIIEAGLGLGEAIVSGSVTPDNFVVQKSDWQIVDSYISEQTRKLIRVDGGGNEWVEVGAAASLQKLPQEKVLELAKLVAHIEQHYGFPCDIEWAVEAGEIFIVQSRPITTLGPITSPTVETWEIPELADLNPSDYDFHGLWKSPLLTCYFWTTIFSPELSAKLSLGVKDLGILNISGGNFFAKKSVASELHAKLNQVVSTQDLSYFKQITSLLEDEHARVTTQIASLNDSPENLEYFKSVMEGLKQMGFLICLNYLFSFVFENDLEQWAKDNQVEPTELSKMIPIIETPIFKRQKSLDELHQDFATHNLLTSDTSAVLAKLQTLPELTGKLDQHIAEYGWAEIIGFLGEETTTERLITIIQEFQVPTHNESHSGEEVAFTLQVASQLAYLREVGTEYFSMASLKLRPFLHSLSGKLGISYKELISLIPSEIYSAIEHPNADALRTLIEQRSNQSWVLLEDLNQREIIANNPGDISRIEQAFLPRPESTGTITGQVANRGIATGRVKVILNSDDFKKITKGDVLVSTMTTPDFVSVMQAAAAIVTDIGGMLSHAAIVSRELGKPCVIGTGNATQLLNDGDLVEVNAETGVITLVEPAQVIPWEKVLQRNFPPIAWSTGAWYEFYGFHLGPLHWIRDREVQIKYNTTQSYTILDPSSYYKTNITEVIAENNSAFECALDEYNQKIFDAVRVQPGSTIEDLKNLNELHKLVYGLMLIGYDIANDIRARIDEVVTKRPDGFEEYLATPWQQTAVERERAAITKARANSATPEILDTLAREFGFIHQDYLGVPWKAEDYLSVLNEVASDTSHMSTELNVSELSEYETWLLVVFKKVMYLYEEGRNAMVRSIWAMKETGSALELPPEKLLYATVQEVDAFCAHEGELPDASIVVQRKNAFAIYFDNGEYRDYTGQNAVQKLIEKLQINHYWEASNEVSETILKGRIAFKGDVTGPARLVFNQEDANNLVAGEILISPMTQVEFLGGIRKCAAIVTDEGGIVCHAAIVAREFGKPCVLATTHATKIFKTGDLVHVDANTGTVSLVI
jgi:pyruvate,water dikinase